MCGLHAFAWKEREILLETQPRSRLLQDPEGKQTACQSVREQSPRAHPSCSSLLTDSKEDWGERPLPTLLRNQYELEMGLYGCKLAPCFWYLGILGVSLEEVMGDSFKESCVKEITCHSKIIKTI